jgi:hypothetical protein
MVQPRPLRVATKDGRTIILLSGEIVEGEADTLKASIKTANDVGKLVSGVRLNSPGGNLVEGLKLADAVRFAKVATNVAGKPPDVTQLISEVRLDLALARSLSATEKQQ